MTTEQEDWQPSCFNSRPEPQQRAENGCDECPWETECSLPSNEQDSVHEVADQLNVPYFDENGNVQVLDD